jgi:hypothetical protein
MALYALLYSFQSKRRKRYYKGRLIHSIFLDRIDSVALHTNMVCFVNHFFMILFLSIE